jgi:hypothetical protein
MGCTRQPEVRDSLSLARPYLLTSARPRRDAVLDQVISIIEASASATNTSVEIVQFQDYWDQQPSFPLAETFYQHQMQYFDPSENPETANFTVSTPEESRRENSAAASSDQVCPMISSVKSSANNVSGQRLLVCACPPGRIPRWRNGTRPQRWLPRAGWHSKHCFSGVKFAKRCD